MLEAIRDRIHADKLYYSFSVGILPTIEGIFGMDSLMQFLARRQKIKGLQWNSKIGNLINKEEIAHMNVFNTNIFDLQDEFEIYLREDILRDQPFQYEKLKVLFEYNTAYGFEIAANQLRDDGNEEKDVRELLMSEEYTHIYAEHVTHVT